MVAASYYDLFFNPLGKETKLQIFSTKFISGLPLQKSFKFIALNFELFHSLNIGLELRVSLVKQYFKPY